ncbi:MAG TPA: hypothetical protein VH796_12745 [Nitrososphaeraceae archaeon]|jgi:hypothetical protein
MGNILIIGEIGPRAPNSNAPLAKGGKTSGKKTNSLRIETPGICRNRANKYPTGIPNTKSNVVETVAVLALSRKAFMISGLPNEDGMDVDAMKIKIAVSGKTR